MRRFTAALAFAAALSLFTAACDGGPAGPNPSASGDALEGAAPAASHAEAAVKTEAAVKNFVAPLSGDQEVPAVETNATGLAKFKLNKAGDALSFKLNVANIENVAAAHIHCAPDGVNGPVGVTLHDGLIEGRFQGTLAAGTISTLDEGNGCEWTALDDVHAALSSGDTYVNVHTTANPPGEIRGQIDRGNGMMRAPTRGPADEATLAQQLGTVREVTKKYRDIEAARADGYGAVSPYVPGMGFHFADGPPFGTDLGDPGVLVYFTNGSYNPAPGEAHDPAHDDDLILGAVEWLVPGDQTAAPPNIFADEASPRALKVSEEEGWHFEEEAEEGFTGLHAWVHRGNSAGVFHSTNPSIE